MEALRRLRRDGWFAVVPGTMLTGLGVFLLMTPVFRATTIAVSLGVILVAAGLVRSFTALHARSSGVAILTVAVAALSLLTGADILASPLIRHGYLTLLLAGYLVVDGLFSTVIAVCHRHEEGWLWSLAGAITSMLLGAMIAAKWPWIPGAAATAAVGLHLVLSGAARANLGVSGRANAFRNSALRAGVTAPASES